MTWAWGKRSKAVREEACVELQLVVDQVLEWSPFDVSLTEGYRDMEDQNRAYEAGLSELKFPDSKHNTRPCDAVHIDPYPIDYVNTQRYFILAGLMVAAGKLHGIELRWLGLTTLRDYAHWEIKT